MSHAFRCELIALVEREKALWDTSTDDYRVGERKSAAWTRVVDQLRATGYTFNVCEVKKAWKNLRDQWRKKRKMTVAGVESNCCEWAFMKYMKFLEGCETARWVPAEVGSAEKRRWSSSTDASSPRSTPPTAVDENEFVVSNSTKTTGEQPSKRKRTTVTKQEADDTSACETTKEEMARSTEENLREKDKFAAFGSFVGSFLRDMPNDEAIQKMNVISQALFQQVVLLDNQYN
ncbi:hypothetical protein GCK32_004726 [Trichostrongylus colubriformis]|uniref:MADF domain-containing protein n=1 Tax=Trichostrongylus colubriformis TaxID=6319 RepID=A0AAN8F3L8_TRICO